MSSLGGPLSDADLSEFLAVFSTLVAEPAVVGCENAFLELVQRMLEDCGVRVERYLGLLVARGNDPSHLLLSAHVDRHGLICTGPGEYQYAAFLANGWDDSGSESVSESLLHTISERFLGRHVRAHSPFSGQEMGQGFVSEWRPNEFHDNLIFSIDGLDVMPPGTAISFVDQATIRDGHISAQLDNVLGVAVIVFLFQRGFSGTALFAAEEEAGKSWRYALSWLMRQQRQERRMLVLDTSPYPSLEQVNAQDLVLRRKDAFARFNPQFSREIEAHCQGLGLSYSYKDRWIEQENLSRTKPLSLGRTELGRLVAASAGHYNGTTLQIPTTGYHTVEETASLQSIRAILQVLSSL